MRLSTYSDYALRVLMHTALRAPERVTVDEVAETFGISRNHLVKVVHELGLNGYLLTRRGIGGGFTLAREPKEIRLGEIVRLSDGATLIDCKDRQESLCCLSPACRLKHVLDEALEACFAVLDRYTLADLVKDRTKMRAAL